MPREMRRRKVQRSFIAAAAIVAAIGALVPASASGADPWSSVWLGQCCATQGGAIVEMEAGEIRWSGFIAKNTGLNTWQSTGSVKVNLGTDEPRDRKSMFFNPGPGDGTWISANRPSALANAPVGPGGTGVFRFRVLAPETPGEYKEYFEPVADGPGGGWLGTMISSGCYPDRWCAAHLIYRVRAQAPPSISIAQMPGEIKGPSAFNITVDASDNVGLDRITAVVDGDPATMQVDDLPAPDANAVDHSRFNLGGQLFENRRSQFSFLPADCTWARGDHTVKVVAYDQLGQVDHVIRTFSVKADPDCDGVSGRGDKCPTLPSLSPDDRDGCPPPRGRAASTTFVFARPGVGSYRSLNKIEDAGVRRVLAGTRVEAFCDPACGHPFKRRAKRDVRLLKLTGLIGRVVPDGTEIVIRATLPRARNVYGRQWKWAVGNGARSKGGECIGPGLSGRPGC